MVSHKKYNLNVNENFVSFLISRLLRSSSMVSLPEWNPNQWLIYLGKVHIYIGPRPWRWSALNMGFVVKRPSRMQEQRFFCFRAGRAAIFGRVWKNPGRGHKFCGRAAPARIWHPHTLVGGVISSAVHIMLEWRAAVHRNYGWMAIHWK
jgi:hypothetical protein